jgi:hypothetical protein
MSSLSILRFFFGSQSSKTSSSLTQNRKSKKFSSSESDRNRHKSKKFSSSENRDRITIIYNKIVYGRNVVIILLIKIRTDLNIPLFGRISFKDVAIAKILYVCLSNIKKIQYKAQIEQIIHSFLDHIKIFFNKWLSQFRAEFAMNANFKLISQWSYRSRFNSWQKERKIQHREVSSFSFSKRESSRSESSKKYDRESSSSSLKLETRELLIPLRWWYTSSQYTLWCSLLLNGYEVLIAT